MKRIPALLLSGVLLLEGLTGCASKQETAAVKNFTAPEKGEELVVIQVKDYGTIKFKATITDADPVYDNEFTAVYSNMTEDDRQALLYYMYIYSNSTD